jgi:membrane-associated phospholipid phosphatase
MHYVIGAIAIGFIILTVFVYLFPLSAVDKEFSEEVQEHHDHLLDTLMKAISWVGFMPNAPIVVISTALIFLFFKYKKEALFLLLTLLSGVVSSVIKLLINRPRPAEPLVRVLLRTQQQSFPSGHVLFYVLFFGFLALLMYELKAIPKYIKLPVTITCLFFIFTIPYSRVYLGAHWFTDVVAGFLLGLICLYVLGSFYIKRRRHKTRSTT